MSIEQCNVPKFFRLSELKNALDDTGHHLSLRTLRNRITSGEIKGLRTEGGQWRVTEEEFNRILKRWGGRASRETGGPRKSHDPEQEYFRSLKKRYRLEPEDYKRMVGAQDGKCGICGCDPATKYADHALQYHRLHVDHQHGQNDKIRGLLCFGCNHGIGRWLDNPALLRAAISYLEIHQKEQAA